MGINTNKNEKLTVKEKIENLKKHHQEVFEKLNEDNPLFLPKTIYGNPLEATLFPSEFKKSRDIYTEKVSRDYESEDPSRTLYKLKFRKDYYEHYQKTPFGTDVKFHVPFSDFEIVTIKKAKIDFGILNPDEDSPIDDMMIRDLAAILWKKPVSQKAWLNTLINNLTKNK